MRKYFKIDPSIAALPILQLHILTKHSMKSPYFILVSILILMASCKAVDKPSSPDTTDVAAVEAIEPDSIQNDSIPQIIYSSDYNYRGADERVNDIIHTKLDIKFDWESQSVMGKALLEVKPYFYDADILSLNARGFEDIHISLVKGVEKQELSFSYDGALIDIELDTIYQENQHYFIEIEYLAYPGKLKQNGSSAIADDRGLYFINAMGNEENKPQQIWSQGETQANSAWFPTIDSPFEKFTQEMFITVDNKFKTLSNGVLIYSLLNEDETRTDYWKMELPHAAYLTMIAVGEFSVVTDQWENDHNESVIVDYYVESAYEKNARDIFGNTPEMISFFSDLLNYPYPWPKYSQVVVRDFVSGAMENTTASVFMEDLQVDKNELLDFHWDDIIAHELFHHWFGNLVTCESWSNLPLNESFATYGEYLWYEYKYGIEEADFHYYEDVQTYLAEAEEKKENLIRFNYNDKEDMFDAHSYQKGGAVLHMLRKYVGERAFFEALHRYLEKFAYHHAEIHDLRQVFEEVTGEDLNWFFNQWFLSSGHPQITVTHEQTDSLLVIEVRQKQDLEETPIFKLPMTIAVWTGEEERHDFPVELDANYQKFEYIVDGKVELVLLDGEQQLLAEVAHQKGLDELIFQYYNGEKLLARYTALQELGVMEYDDVTAFDKITAVYVNALREDPFWGVRQLAAEYFDNYDGPYEAEIVEALDNSAINDPKSQVRASAVTSLVSFGADQFKPTILRLMKDSSYMVRGAALLAFTSTSDPNIDQVLIPYEEIGNAYITYALADYFASNKKYDKNDWFLGRLKGSSPEDEFYLLQYYGILISEAPEGIIRKAIPYLHKRAIEGTQEYVRLAAYQSLSLLTETEELKTIKKEIKDAEKNEALKNYYDQMK